MGRAILSSAAIPSPQQWLFCVAKRKISIKKKKFNGNCGARWQFRHTGSTQFIWSISDLTPRTGPNWLSPPVSTWSTEHNRMPSHPCTTAQTPYPSGQEWNLNFAIHENRAQWASRQNQADVTYSFTKKKKYKRPQTSQSIRTVGSFVRALKDFLRNWHTIGDNSGPWHLLFWVIS